MPTYEYICKACKHELEEFQMMSAKPLRKCPSCGKNSLERQIGVGAGFIFKGGGFYETDYRSDSYKKAAEADSKPAASSDDKAHVHTGSCGCGQKPANECPSSAATPTKDDKPTKSSPTKISSSASSKKKPSGKKAN